MPLCNATDKARLIYAYYADEIDKAQTCQGDDGFKYNRFTRVRKNCAEMLTESACHSAKNPLIESQLPFPETQPRGLKTPDHFTAKHEYMIYVSKALAKRYKDYKDDGGSKPKAEIALFHGVGPEIALFGLRSFYEHRDTGVLITMPGIEAGWPGYGAAWGIGIDKTIIGKLLERADVPDVEWKVTVIAGYSTGYRGLNGTIVNAAKLGIDLSAVKRAVLFDCLYNADDHAANNKVPEYAKRYSQRAIDTLIKANSNAKVVVYRVTVAGTPAGKRNKGLLVEIQDTHLVLVDLLKKERFDVLRALFLARFIQNGVESGIVAKSDLPSTILEMLKLLPARGTLVTGKAGSGEENLDDWLAKPDVKLRMKELYTLKHKNLLMVQFMINLTLKHGLLGGWESSDWHDMMHRYFVQELGRQHLT